MIAESRPPLEPTRECWIVERHKASQLATILKIVGQDKLTGSVTINLSQGTPVNLEVRRKVAIPAVL